MHKFVYPTSDAFIDNHPDYRDDNFGRDEILEISSVNYTIKTYVITSSMQSAITDFVGLRLIGFSGNITGSITGSASNVSGSIIGCGLVLAEEDNC
jgi:hypothetical protein